MEKEGFDISRHLSLRFVLWVLTCVLILSSCAMPRIVILKDPLSAAEHNDLGVIYEQKGMADLAEKEYGKAFERDRKWYLPCFNLGNLFYEKGDLVSAEQYYRKALTLDSSNPDVMNNLANLLDDISLDKEATELITRALCIERKPEYLDTYKKIVGRFPDEEDGDLPQE